MASNNSTKSVVKCDTSPTSPVAHHFSIYETSNPNMVEFEGCVPRRIAQLLFDEMAKLT